MKQSLSLLTIMVVIVSQISAFSIQGTWKLTNIQQSQIQSQLQPKIEIKNIVFRNTTLRWSLSLSGCSELKAMFDIRGDNIFVSLSTIYMSNQVSENCNSSRVVISKRFQSLLRKVFKFQIIYNYMVFSDSEGRVLFKFERTALKRLKDQILGTWMSKPISGGQGQVVEISEQYLAFCDKKVQIKYNVSNNKLELGNKSIDESCQNNQLLSVFSKFIYFAKRKNSLELYDQNDNLIATLELIMDLQATKKFQQSQKNRPIQTPSISIQANTETTPSLGFSELVGKWSISSVFQGPNIIDGMVFIISPQALLISGDCNTYTFSFSLLQSSPITVKRQNFKQTNNKCVNEDENIYKTGLSKVAILKPQIQGNRITVKIYDSQQNEIFSIQKPYFAQPVPRQSAMPNRTPPPTLPTLPIPPTPIPTPFPSRPPPPTLRPQQIPPGKYTLLLLKRRDMARKIITIDNESFKLSICNEYLISLTASNEKIKLTSSVLKQNNCDTNNDKIYINTLQSVTNFKSDDLDFILIGPQGQQLIVFNFVG